VAVASVAAAGAGELVEVPLSMMDDVVVPEGVVVSADVEVLEEAGIVDVDAPSVVEDVGIEVATLLVAEVPNVGAVDV
jgi:hypothetical protein